MANKKSTKTAHVLNLISKKPVQSAETTENNEQSPSDNTAQQKPAITSPVVSSIKSSLEKAARDEVLSDKIKDNLLEELDTVEKSDESQIANSKSETTVDELKNVTDFVLDELEEPNDAEEFIRENTPSAEDAIKHEKPRSEALEQKDNPNINESDNTASNAVKAALNDYLNNDVNKDSKTDEIEQNIPHNLTEKTEPSKFDDFKKEFLYMNVIEVLVREQITSYIEKFNVCKCSRCVADVMALALSNLPPKYIVIENHEKIAQLLNFYDSKFSVAIMTELTKACLKVSESPRHKSFND